MVLRRRLVVNDEGLAGRGTDNLTMRQVWPRWALFCPSGRSCLAHERDAVAAHLWIGDPTERLEELNGLWYLSRCGRERSRLVRAEENAYWYAEGLGNPVKRSEGAIIRHTPLITH